MKLKLFLIFLNIGLLAATSFSQSTTNCNQLANLINFDPVLKNFRLLDRSDSLILIDKNKIVPGTCQVINWGQNKLQITHDSNLIQKSIKGGSAARFNGQRQYFVIDNFEKKANHYLFTIFHASSNEFIDCKVLKEKNQYKLVWFAGMATLSTCNSIAQTKIEYPHCNCTEVITYPTGNTLKPDGNYQFICDNKPIITGQYRNGIKSGKWTTQTAKGTIIKNAEYLDGYIKPGTCIFIG